MSQSRPCPVCQGVRLHRIRTSTEAQAGKRLRVLACAACENEIAIEPALAVGIACPRCGNTTFEVVYTRHRTGSTVRVKQCRNRACGRRIRTCERVESNVA